MLLIVCLFDFRVPDASCNNRVLAFPVGLAISLSRRLAYSPLRFLRSSFWSLILLILSIRSGGVIKLGQPFEKLRALKKSCCKEEVHPTFPQENTVSATLLINATEQYPV
ncbi:hypothetical protein NDU88_001377 [Pleurodeles waltl]|uniref:Uncharacterized protein n=1 Tax=Pleurodeles waltl TaxID=8319 RepID=A0AAV7Q2Y8_PLEWA|nr:hypothetical protein NDU88_001377 [Pleurodeles waltl]